MALIARLKTWVSGEDVNAADINAEFDNVLDNIIPTKVDDYSANAAQMQSTADPGEVGTESLATTLAGELQRIRFILKEITGEAQWYESPISSLTGLANAIGTGLTDNRIVSGRVRATSAQPMHLVPNGAARTVKLDGTPTNFIYYVEGIEYTIDADVTITSLTAAPSSNNTCLINDATAADQFWTKYAGENGSEIPIDTAGTEITALVGKYAAFKLANGSADEYFIAKVKSSTSLTEARRGYFFDSTDAPVPRVTYANNDTITLMKLTWVFAKADETLTATYTNPVWGDDEPTSPAIGDYWFDTGVNKWKKYDVGSFADADATLVGVCIQDATNTVGARSFDKFANYDDANSMEIILESNTQVRSRFPGYVINVYGTTIKSEYGNYVWDMTLDLESGVTEAASTYYYFYITETGDKVISDKKPHDRRADLQGHYHPSHPWRCVGFAFNDGSSNLGAVESYYRANEGEVIRAIAVADTAMVRDKINTFSGASFTEMLPPAALCRGRILTFVHGGTSITQVYTLDGFGSETIAGATTYALYTNGESLRIISDGSNWIVLDHFANSDWTNDGAITFDATTTAPTKGSATITVDALWWRRNGKDLIGRIAYTHSAAGTATAGTGDYKIRAVPSGITIDTTKLSAWTTEEDSGAAWAALNLVGNGAVSTSDGSGWIGAVVYDGTYIRMAYESGAQGGSTQIGFIDHAVHDLATASVSYLLTFSVPITEFKP